MSLFDLFLLILFHGPLAVLLLALAAEARPRSI